MNKFRNGLGLAAVAIALGAAGLYTNGLVGPNAIGVVTGGPGASLLSAVPSRGTLAVDTGMANGQQPQTVSATAFNVVSVAMELVNNKATSTAGAATLNTNGGMIVTEALTTAPGSTYTMTVTDSAVLASTQPMVSMYSGSNTAVGSRMELTNVAVSSGSAVLTFTNVGTTALNGTMLIAFHI